MKYNFDLILTDEQLKANRLRTIQDEKDKRYSKIAIIIAMVGLVLAIILLIALNNSDERTAKKTCNGKFEVITKMDGEKYYNCKGE